MQEAEKTVYIVHSIDTEGPLHESLEATFQRIHDAFGIQLEPTEDNLIRLQKKQIPIGGKENDLADFIDPKYFCYNGDWSKIDEMLNDILSPDFRNSLLDSFGNGWIYNWFCLDHVGYEENPRRRDIGYHNIFDHYLSRQKNQQNKADGIHFHYHPQPFSRSAHHCATHFFSGNETLFQVLSRRIIDRGWFPSTFRPGFNTLRPDSNWFLEQYIPFCYGNQNCLHDKSQQPDLTPGRFGDWRRAPLNWQPYHPDHDDYQVAGNCRRWELRCLNISTRVRNLSQQDVNQAFAEAQQGKPVVLAFTNHDFRDMRPEIKMVQNLLQHAAVKYPDVSFRFSEARDAARRGLKLDVQEPINFEIIREGNEITISSDGPTFGPQPFFALKTKDGRYFHDNLDFQVPFKKWSYMLDSHTFKVEALEAIGVGACDATGNVSVNVLDLADNRQRVTFW